MTDTTETTTGTMDVSDVASDMPSTQDVTKMAETATCTIEAFKEVSDVPSPHESTETSETAYGGDYDVPFKTSEVASDVPFAPNVTETAKTATCTIEAFKEVSDVPSPHESTETSEDTTYTVETSQIESDGLPEEGGTTTADSPAAMIDVSSPFCDDTEDNTICTEEMEDSSCILTSASIPTSIKVSSGSMSVSSTLSSILFNNKLQTNDATKVDITKKRTKLKTCHSKLHQVCEGRLGCDGAFVARDTEFT
ncbi:unnamed protein product [Peronospora belbahrii]|uniref:Uncharacterized protein n=1 Tax=Peronospora belbahrii TaxID=622444 RepID=A0AAU9KTG5_9STRA|nr:unnamed protein product [Peronospora belbahrii]